MPHTDVHRSPARLGPEVDWDPSHPDCFCFPLFPDILSPLTPPPPSDPPQPPCSASSSTSDSRCRGSHEVPRTVSEWKRGRRGARKTRSGPESGAPVGAGPRGQGQRAQAPHGLREAPWELGQVTPSLRPLRPRPEIQRQEALLTPPSQRASEEPGSRSPWTRVPRARALRNEAPIRLPRSQETGQWGRRGSFWEANLGLLRTQDCQLRTHLHTLRAGL